MAREIAGLVSWMRLRRLVLLLGIGTCGGHALAMSVVFINPGKSDEIYWVTAAHAMQAAARSLNVQLEVLYAQRDHRRQVAFAQQLADRAPDERPDYVIASNDYAVGPEIIRILDAAGIKTFFAFSSIDDPSQRSQTGGPRGRFSHWLGSLEPQAQDAGYLTARALIERGRTAHAQAPDGKLHLLAIAGDRSTPSSIFRNEGMRRAVVEAKDVVLDQEVYGAWNRDKAAEQSVWLFQRFPTARLVWCGNDLMAFGAMAAWEQRGGRPGQNAWFSGVNTSQEALEAVRSGRLTALAGGHFIAGAWALVLIYDYQHGRDFASQGMEMKQPMFMLFSPVDAARFEARFADLRFDGVDFRRFSKVLNPGLKRYDFNFRQLMRQQLAP